MLILHLQQLIVASPYLHPLLGWGCWCPVIVVVVGKGVSGEEDLVDLFSERLEFLAVVLWEGGAEVVNDLVNGGEVVFEGLLDVLPEDLGESSAAFAAASSAAGAFMANALHCYTERDLGV